MTTKKPQWLAPSTDATTDPDVVQLKQLHDETIRTTARAIVLAIQMGEILNRRRAEFPRRAAKGEGFGDWVDENLSFGKRTAWGYIRAYNDRERLLAMPDATLRMVLGVGSGKSKDTNHDDHDDHDDDHDNATSDPSNKIVSGKTTPQQEKRARALADFFGVEVAKARSFVLATATKPRQRKPTTDPTVAKRTIRVPTDTDTIIAHVARTTNRPYAVVALELFEIGRKRFVARYELNP